MKDHYFDVCKFKIPYHIECLILHNGDCIKRYFVVLHEFMQGTITFYKERPSVENE